MKVAFLWVLTFVFVWVVLKKGWMSKLIETSSIYWFRFALSFFVLFIVNLIAGYVGLFVPINLASAIAITILGFPGFVTIVLFAIIL